MTHAYSESYLNNAKDRLSSFFDYAINAFLRNDNRLLAELAQF